MGLTRKETYSKKHSSAGRRWGFNRIYGAQDDGTRTLYMTRAWLGRLRFHLFHRGDADPDCHDHPWGFWTFPLRSYVEEYLEPRIETRFGPLGSFNPDLGLGERESSTTRVYYVPQLRIVRAFRLHYRPAVYRHRVLGAYAGTRPSFQINWKREGLVPTIVWRERASRPWGFTKLRDGKWCWVPWITYVYEGGKNAPCE